MLPCYTDAQLYLLQHIGLIIVFAMVPYCLLISIKNIVPAKIKKAPVSEIIIMII